MLNHLATEHQVIIFDNAGVGLSEGTTPLTITEMTEVAVSLIHALGLQYVDLLGWSMGGFVALDLTIRYPHLVRRLILAATAGPGIPGTKTTVPEAGKVAQKPVNTDEDLLFLFYHETPTSQTAGSASLKRITERQQPIAPTVAGKSVGSQGAAMGAFLSGKTLGYTRLRDISQPTLIANGEHDKMLPARNSELLADLIPNAELVIYPDANHGFLFQYVDVFAQRVLDFLRA